MSFKRKTFHNSSRHVPSEVIPFLEGLEKIVGVEKINFGKFISHGSKKREIEAKYYNEQQKTLTIEIYSPEYIQTILIKAEKSEIKPICDFVKSYNF